MMWHWFVPVAAIVSSAVALVPPPTAAQQQAMFDAVRQMLEQAHVQKADMPSKIISAEAVGQNQYKVHMQMEEGNAWFILKWTGQKWEVTGLNQ
ncbi:MAG TPA: hypothetical protein VNT75_00155 [Symbiobacteriaceae bacterium]|nr:hypothetical protein [Symbiobacteriaceae bacterium]